VIESSSLLQLTVDAGPWFVLPQTLQLGASAAVTNGDALSSTVHFHNGINPGRALRCLIMSFLC
jgi:hypothetical protein